MVIDDQDAGQRRIVAAPPSPDKLRNFNGKVVLRSAPAWGRGDRPMLVGERSSAYDVAIRLSAVHRAANRGDLGSVRVVFLDIDGVLNSSKTPNPRKFPYVADPGLVARLRDLLDRAGAVAVLSSTWRYDPVGLLAAKHWLVPFVDATPDLPHRPRRDEISAWLAGHPDVTRFAIIDDENDDLDGFPLFQPSRADGLTPEIADAAVAFLRGESDRDMRNGLAERVVQKIAARLRGHPG